MDEQRGIGKSGRLPWRLSADLKRFKSLTMGHHLIMGHRTFDSIGKPLPGRTNIVLSRDSNFQPAGCLVAHSMEEALELARQRGECEVFIIGGADVFAQSLGFADRLYLTLVHTHSHADVFFPPCDRSKWVQIDYLNHAADEKNEHPFTVKTFVRQLDPPRAAQM